MHKIKTKTGFECEINEIVFDDIEFFDILREFDSGNPQNFGLAVRKVFGNDVSKLYDHVRTEDGRVPIEAIASEMMDICESLDEGKK